MGQDQGKIGPPKGMTYASFVREQAKMVHVTTRDQVARTKANYEVEADRLLDLFEALPEPIPPLCRSALDTPILITKKEKMVEELHGASEPMRSAARLPSDGVVRTLALYQTLDMRESVLCVKRQEAISTNIDRLRFYLSNMRALAAHNTHELATLINSLGEVDRMSESVDHVASTIDDMSSLVLEIDGMLTEEERARFRRRCEERLALAQEEKAMEVTCSATPIKFDPKAVAH